MMTALTYAGTIGAASTAKSRKRLTLVSLAAIALLIGVTSGLTYTHIDRMQLPELRNEDGNQLGALKASRKVRCIMPPAWRKDCGK
jgi:hypothetical protein